MSILQVVMGNSESQYSIQGPKGTSFFFPGKQKPYSLKFPSSKDDDLSPHTWWKNAPRGSGFKARSLGRGCLSPPKSRPPYSSGRYDYISQGAKGGQWCGAPGRRIPSDGYRENPYGAECDAAGGGGDDDGCEGLEEQSSPRVVIKKDGSLRVEFTNTSGSPLVVVEEGEEDGGPVQLLKFSPNVDAAAAATAGRHPQAHCGGPPPVPASSTARTGKGGSLSSDGSWYDSPWGPGAEQEPPLPHSASGTLVLSPGSRGSSDERESSPMSVAELYRDPTMAATFPVTGEPVCLYREHNPSQKPYRASFASALDVPAEEEEEEEEEEEGRLEARQYSSYTLPCRRPKAHTLSEDLGGCPDPEQYQAGPEFGFQKKDSIKNRIRRLSDWTGSLARKKKSQVS